ncbi:ATP-dependent zinc metalloprotease FtsH [Desulfovibrio gilichinskyi]|uniref:ATP-dependent zinc metalloprotease FtsH n=1 Tax=Desulfovibrio gilichinskyi TaxID=1519643 RepID=A0A1X7CA90_9BACT|nr:ATP-dependent zinc metalloprotease FtsH [Desulfovibrio gilichinskyi]SME92809.1 membrane protease FtsH catalytic subunit [Desulfovibrio gilichinskyi]
MNSFAKNLLVWVTIMLVMIVLFNLFNQPAAPQLKVSYTDFLMKVDQGEILQVKIQGHKISGVLVGDKRFVTYSPNDPTLVQKLINNKIEVVAEPEEDSPWYMTLFISWFPMLLLVGVWIFFMRQMQGGGGSGGRGGAMSFGRSKARMLNEETAKVTFQDVAGVDEAKEELSEIVQFLSEPKKFTRLGGRIPKGVLLIGSPGTGKTLLARAVAGEAGVPFFSISGSDFVEMFVGVGASRVRDLFAQGKKNAPCLIFIDEIDAVGRQRGAGLGGGHDEREQTLNQLLVEMDGFESNEGVILIAATNRPDVLDPALLRPGRFDRQVVVPTPDVRGRAHILSVHTRKTPLAEEVDLDVIARGTPGFSGADLENLVNEAALYAAKNNQDYVNMIDFEEAKDKVLMGRERRSLIINDKEKETTAYHEAGHALIAKLLVDTDPVHKVTIIPRGRALGVTQQLPVDDRHNYSKRYLEDTLVMLLGGRVAEELILNQMTTGASNDIERATKMARSMVCQWGMSDKLGPMTFGETNDQVFLGKEFGHSKDFSEDTSRLIDSEVRRIIDTAHEQAKTLLGENKDSLHKLAAALLERETISGDEIDTLINGGKLPPLEKVTSTAKPSTAAKAYASTAKTGYTPVEEKAEENITDSEEEKKDFSFDGSIESDDSENNSAEVDSSEDKKDSK